jgi:hypothetical protein
MRIVEAPFCEVLDILEPVKKHAETHDFGLKVRLVNKEGKKSPVYVHRIGFFIFPVLEVPVIKDERSG